MKYIEKYLDYLKVVKKYSNKTILSYYDDLIEYNEFLGNNFKNILNIDINITKEYLKYLYERGINKNSISRKLSSIRGFYNYLVKEEILTSSSFNSIPNPKKDLYLPKFLNDKELNKITIKGIDAMSFGFTFVKKVGIFKVDSWVLIACFNVFIFIPLEEFHHSLNKFFIFS